MLVSMQWNFFKKLLVIYLVISGIFFLCTSAMQASFVDSAVTSIQHQEPPTDCTNTHDCSSALSPHIEAFLPTSLIMMLASMILLGFFVSKTLLLQYNYLYSKHWHDSGGGVHLFDVLQKLFARGILHPKTFATLA